MIARRGTLTKRYISDAHGVGAAYWDSRWKNGPLTVADLARQVDLRLVRRIERYFKRGASLLEGGCGSGAYVAYFASRGYRVVGVDYATETVERLNRELPSLDIRFGDVCALPFADESFDAYYSGGVIEHFEEGPERALREAYRVLKPGGLFFVTVPWVNCVRFVAGRLWGDRVKHDLDGQLTFLKEGLGEFRVDKPPHGFHFHEYVLEASVMRRILREMGFVVVDEMPFSARWGMLDVQIYRRLAGIDLARRHIGHRLAAAPLRVVGWLERRPGRTWEFVAGLIGSMVGNVRLYVAVKPAGARQWGRHEAQ